MKRPWLRWSGLAAVGVLAVLFAGLRVPQNIHALWENYQRMRQLQIENADLNKEIEARRQRIRELKESRQRQELEMRKQRKMLRQDEKSLVTPEPPPAPSTR